jgi:hypothetical protein
MKTQKILCAVAALLTVLSLSACGSGSAEAEEPKEPIDISKFTYVNEDMGFGIIYPEDFTAFGEDEIRTIMADNIETIRSMFANPEDAETTISQSIPVSQAMKYPIDYADGVNPNINIIVQKTPEPIDDVLELTRQIVREANLQGVSVTFEDPTATQIGGRDAAVTRVSVFLQGMEVAESQYYVENNGYLAVITLSVGDESEFAELEAIVNTVEFIK